MLSSESIRHHGPISGIAVSPGFVATAGYDNQVILWDLSDHRPLARSFHDDLVNQCSFSDDGSLLATASSDRTARIWCVPELRLLSVMTAHDDDVAQVSFHPNGNHLASCSYDGTVVISDLSGKPVVRCVGHTGLIERFAWSPDGTRIATCGTDGSIRLWDAVTGTCLSNRSGLQFDVDDICFIDNDTVVAGMDDGRLLLIKADQDTIIDGHTAGIKCISRTGDRLLTIAYDQTFSIWRIDARYGLLKVSDNVLIPDAWARSGSLLGEHKVAFASFGSRYLVYDLVAARWECGDYVASASINTVATQNGTVYAIGDAGTLMVDGAQVATVKSLCNDLALAGDKVYAAGQEGVLFDVLASTRCYAHHAPVNCLLTVPAPTGGQSIALGCYDGSLLLLDQAHNALVPRATYVLGPSAVKGMAYKDHMLLCGLANGALVMVNLADGTVERTIACAHDAILNDVAFFASGFATVSRDMTMRRWTMEGQLTDTVRTRHPKSVKCLATSADGRYSASGSYAGTVDVYDHSLATWVGRLRRPTMSGISALTWCARRANFLAASYDGNIYEVTIHED